MAPNTTVFIIDDDAESRGALRYVLEGAGLRVEAYANPLEFRFAYQSDQTGCLVVELLAPRAGRELQEKLTGEGIQLPILFLSASGDVNSAVAAMKAGAFDFIEKPYDPQRLVNSVRRALDTDARYRQERSRRGPPTARRCSTG